MEEQKNNKEVKMTPGKNKQADQKLTYEQLKDIADRLWNENKYLKKQLQQASDYVNTINRLDYLFKVAEIANKQGTYTFTPEFTNKCFEEIESLLSTPAESKNEENDKEN